ncbi:MAG: tRNA epoxyqueuosine(34) reductase QueG [Rhodothermales bacterium]|nr:tRNA epoxyqueuosine(34) reductase QueG [Rhodothermales bacterium]
MDIPAKTRLLKKQASDMGFDACGVARAETLDREAARLEEWLERGFNGTMNWMEENAHLRADPRLLFPGARSIVSVLQSYHQEGDQPEDPAAGRISRYAWNKDYHRILRKKLSRLLQWMDAHIGPVKGRAFVDSAPFMDKAWAQRAGLGWIGKHSNLISTEHGSYFFIAELIVDIELSYDQPVLDHCGSCTRCIDACPTQAIVQPYVVDGSRCISYLTIEHREDDIDPELQSQTGNWIFGCDVCQEVCPWNKFSTPTTEERFRLADNRHQTRLADWAEMDEQEFEDVFAGSAVKRTGYSGFQRNVRVALMNAGERHT